ncbi:hypothetical protein ACFQ0G_53495 [Streptomyces chiangmaiensis]|uniref:hypothetical protein n=1 Tax=Streptomyces chiangmaiensis TaxID=766497 RepID=UPI0031E61615
MRIRHLARLQFEADGPAVEGEWTVPGTAQDRYTESVVIRLIEETDGVEHVRKIWTAAQGEAEDPAA